ncbi:unnamed protein product [Sphagnum jensenii]|uniref:Plant heme peroxidase family profile domain-containing protein n=1 Tax=Sphagnum jensenii TaxID=128206 RepID=A0ABP0VZZ8_9BRYO
MGATGRISKLVLITSLIITIAHSCSVKLEPKVPKYLEKPLKFDFYKKSCPQATGIVEKVVSKYSEIDPTNPAPLMRLFFHDCFVQGCDASVLLNSTTKIVAEKDASINFSLGDFNIIDEIKAELEHACPETVSCADVLALTAVHSIHQAGGPLYPIELGRRDSLTSYAPSSTTNLPAFSLNISGLLENFANVGLDLVDLVALSGGHTIGQGHCSSISNRIFPVVDSHYKKGYGQDLLAQCTDNGTLKAPAFDANVQFFNDPVTSLTFDNQYFKNLQMGLGLFTSDESLLTDSRTQRLVKLFAEDQDKFFKQFGVSFRKMGKINVLTGTQGQVRKQCWVRSLPVILSLVVAVTTLMVISGGRSVEAQLVNNFYATHGCPNAENLITSVVTSAINSNKANAPGLLRMHFHDCFVRGCDGSVLIDSPSEKDAIPNQTLHGFEVIDAAKAAVEKACPGIVSCADILALAAQISVKISSGGRITWKVPTGRRDGLVSSAADPLTFLPAPNSNVATLTSKFATAGLSVPQMVALSGAHSIGVAHCSAFANRLSPTVDPTLNPAFAASLKLQCPAGSNNVVNLDVTTPTRLDQVYYTNLKANKGLLTSDQVLETDPSTSGLVTANSNFNTFAANFRSAMLAMGNINVLTGTAGQIRLNCRKFN